MAIENVAVENVATEHLVRRRPGRSVRGALVMAALLALTLGMAIPAGCATTNGEGGLKPLVQTDPRDELLMAQGRVWSDAIRSRKLFDRFSERIEAERFCKILIDLKTNQIYFFDVNVYPMHSDFVFRQIYRKEPTPQLLGDFMMNYEEEKPRFLLAYLIHHIEPNLWTFSFWDGDRMLKSHVEQVYKRLQDTFFAADRLKFRPDSLHHERVADADPSPGAPKVPYVTNDEIYKQASYQAFTTGTGIGKLRIVRDADLKNLTYDKNEIVILKASVPDISVVAGIISEQFSTPLSHVALRARAWGVPHMGLKNAAELYSPLEGKVVFLEAKKGGHSLRLATEQEIAAWSVKKLKKRKIVLPAKNLAEQRLLRLTELRVTQVGAYGAKSSNLGEIARSKPKGFKVPPGFGIPIFYYDQHVKAAGLDKRLEALLADASFKGDAAHRKAKLAEIRAAVMAAPIDKKLMAQVKTMMAAIGGGTAFVRSSTNAEDLPGFNGAGLYDTVPNVSGEVNLARAIKQVWASVWNMRAFEERTFYGIDHMGTYGAVLVQRAVNATAAGVLVTANMYDKRDDETYTINAKSGLGMKVVQGKKIPEQLLVNVVTGKIKVLSRSDEDTMLVFDKKGGVKEVAVKERGKPVLTAARVKTLIAASKAVAALFKGPDAQDIEWLFVGEACYIVQSRPYVN